MKKKGVYQLESSVVFGEESDRIILVSPHRNRCYAFNLAAGPFLNALREPRSWEQCTNSVSVSDGGAGEESISHFLDYLTSEELLVESGHPSIPLSNPVPLSELPRLLEMRDNFERLESVRAICTTAI
jgi:hypothetical protein